MIDFGQWSIFLGVVVVAAPFCLTCLLGLSSLLDWKLSEHAIVRSIQAAIISGLVAAVAVLIGMLALDQRHIEVPLGDWVAIPHYEFPVKFVFDRLSVPFAILSFVLSGTISAFASKYMHRERGFNRFFMLYALFVLGMVISALAGNIETMFVGWELVGLSSALLVAFFHERPNAARNGLWVWVVYRVADAAFLLAAVVMQNMLHIQGDFDRLSGGGVWPERIGEPLQTRAALIMGLLFLFAAAGKSGLVPFLGWLPRAMEGPTPSSAVFYGALSVHLGAFLLLRVSPILDGSLLLSAAVVIIGLTTSVLAYLAGSVQTDIKSALSFASLSQVGLIVAETGLGFRYIALIHLLGHACLRTLQFVRAPTLLQDYHLLENAMGSRLPRASSPWDRFADPARRSRLYRLALERGYLDAWLVDYLVGPFVRLFRWCDGLERKWTDFLTGRSSRESDRVQPQASVIEELV